MRQLLKITTTFALALVFSVGMAFGQSHDATVDQIGDDSEADIEQLGSDNEATVFQSEELGVFGQVSGDANHLADILQDGSNNAADVDQRAEDTEALIEQTGSGNVLEADDYGPGSVTQGQVGEDNSIDALQDGDNNVGRINQAGRDFDADLTQDGDNNEANLNMVGAADLGSATDINNADFAENFEAFVTQNGDGNFADVQQLAFDLASVNQATVDQTGDDNYVELSQGDGTNTATITQGDNLGDYENVARLDQQQGSTADVLQEGNRNRLSAVGAKFDFATQVNSTLDLDQDGNDNWAQVDQQASGSSATINQEGSRNTSVVDQQP
jgi:hypothetical protein